MKPLAYRDGSQGSASYASHTPTPEFKAFFYTARPPTASRVAVPSLSRRLWSLLHLCRFLLFRSVTACNPRVPASCRVSRGSGSDVIDTMPLLIQTARLNPLPPLISLPHYLLSRLNITHNFFTISSSTTTTQVMISRVEYRKKLQSSMSVKTKITYPSYRGKENIPPPMRIVDGLSSSPTGLSSPVRARRTAAVVGLRRTSTGLGPGTSSHVHTVK